MSGHARAAVVMRAALVRGGMLPRLQSLAADPGRAPGTRCAGWLVYRIKSALPRPQGHGLEDHREWARACGPLEGAEQRHRRYRCSMGVHQDAEEGHRGRLRAVTTIRGGRCVPRHGAECPRGTAGPELSRCGRTRIIHSK